MIDTLALAVSMAHYFATGRAPLGDGFTGRWYMGLHPCDGRLYVVGVERVTG